MQKTLLLSNLAHQKIRGFIDNCKEEISGMGKIEVTHRGFLVTDINILKQTVTGATTKLDDDALGKFCYELTKAKDDIKKWSLWWHSHAGMSTFFSDTDKETIMRHNSMDFLVSLVGNHRDEWDARFDSFRPHHATNDLYIEVESLLDQDILDVCKQQIKELVTFPQVHKVQALPKPRKTTGKVVKWTRRQRKLWRRQEEGAILSQQEELELLPMYNNLDIDDSRNW